MTFLPVGGFFVSGLVTWMLAGGLRGGGATRDADEVPELAFERDWVELERLLEPQALKRNAQATATADHRSTFTLSPSSSMPFGT
jgi:hypothetical protein